MGMGRRKGIAMDKTGSLDTQALFHLMSWLSPSYPVGAYTYSHGIEYAVEAGLISTREDICSWIAAILDGGSGRSDCIFLAAAHRAVRQNTIDELRNIAELGLAFCSTRELELETTQQGRAFIRVTNDVSPSLALKSLADAWSGPVIYPVVVAIVAAEKNIPLAETLTAYLHGFISNLVSAAVRIIPLGQTDGQRVIAALAPQVRTQVEEMEKTTLDDLGSATLMVDWCSSQHETQYTRLFRS